MRLFINDGTKKLVKSCIKKPPYPQNPTYVSKYADKLRHIRIVITNLVLKN